MYEILHNGTYLGSSISHYYSLQLSQSGNAFLNIAGDNGTSAIYDINLNFITDINSIMHLEAGSYIVNARYSSPNLAAMNVYIPQLDSSDNLVQVNTGSYVGSTWDHYYGLTIDNDTNVLLNVYGDRGTSAIYDPDLNLVSNITTAPIHLTVGYYIIHAAYSSKNQAKLIVFIPGDSYAETLIGSSANDMLDGGQGADTLQGSSGNDTLIGGAGSDKLDGGTGTDTIVLTSVVGTSSDSGRVVVSGANNDKGQDTLTSFSLTDDIIKVVASNVTSFVHGTDTSIGVGMGIAIAGDRASFSKVTGLIELNQISNNNWKDRKSVV